MKRLGSAVAIIVVIASMALVPAVTTLGAANGPCVIDTHDASNSRWYGVVNRNADAKGYSGFKGVIGDATAAPLTLCSGGDERSGDFVAILPANMQDANHIVQIGMAKYRSSGWHFYYSYDGSGTPINGDGWFDGPPVMGHRYRFKINLYGSGNSLVTFCIRDLTDNTAYLCRDGRPNPFGTSDKTATDAWWGVESNNWNNAMGPVLGDGYISMRNMQYDPVGNTSWQITHPDTAECFSQDAQANHSWKTSKWACYTEDYNYTDDQLQVESLP